jgi:hypothetical protein
MPGTLVFRYMRNNPSVAANGVVRGNLAGRRRKMPDHFFDAVENRGMNDNGIHDRASRPVVAVGRRKALRF